MGIVEIDLSMQNIYRGTVNSRSGFPSLRLRYLSWKPVGLVRFDKCNLRHGRSPAARKRATHTLRKAKEVETKMSRRHIVSKIEWTCACQETGKNRLARERVTGVLCARRRSEHGSRGLKACMRGEEVRETRRVCVSSLRRLETFFCHGSASVCACVCVC
jgi:hypothetical protein